MKSILVPVEQHTFTRSVLDTTLLVAGRFGSHVEGLAVWMRDLLGMSDDLERLGQRVWIRRLEAPVGEFRLGLQAPLNDLLG